MFSMIKARIFVAVSLFFCSFLLHAEVTDVQGLKVKSSEFGVVETIDRLESILAKKGITVFARIDHAAGAEKIGSNLTATQLLIFGNPKLGTPLLQQQRTIAIDLPLKAIAWEDTHGKVWLGYNDPDYISQRHNINGLEEVINKMTGALNKFTDYATGVK